MQLPTWLIEFWNANSGNIIVSLVLGVIFFVLGPIGLWFSGRRIRQERVRKAKDALLDLLEGMLVSQETIDEQKLSILFRAIERDVDINIGTSYDLESLLEDVALRFEKSKHLDAAQKDKYASEVRRLSQDLKAKAEKPKERPIPRSYVKIIEDLKEALNKNDLTAAQKSVDELEGRLRETTTEEFPLNFFRVYRRMYERNPLQFIIIFLTVLTAYVFFLFYYIILRGR